MAKSNIHVHDIETDWVVVINAGTDVEQVVAQFAQFMDALRYANRLTGSRDVMKIKPDGYLTSEF